MRSLLILVMISMCGCLPSSKALDQNLTNWEFLGSKHIKYIKADKLLDEASRKIRIRSITEATGLAKDLSEKARKK